MVQELKVYKKLSGGDSQMKYTEVNMLHLLALSSRITPFDTWESMSNILPHLCPAAKDRAVSSQL